MEDSRQKLQAEVTANALFASSQQITADATNLSKSQLLSDKKKSVEIWTRAIQDLKKIQSGTQPFKMAQKKITEYTNNIKEINKNIDKIQQAELRQKEQIREQEQEAKNKSEADKFIQNYLEYAVKTGERSYGYWCEMRYASSLFSPREYEILQGRIFKDSAYYNIRITSSTKGVIPVINTWKFYLKKKNQKWCMEFLSEL